MTRLVVRGKGKCKVDKGNNQNRKGTNANLRDPRPKQAPIGNSRQMGRLRSKQSLAQQVSDKHRVGRQEG